MDGNTRLCTATAAAALKETFGGDGQPGSYADLDTATRSCSAGHNMRRDADRAVDAHPRPPPRARPAARCRASTRAPTRSPGEADVHLAIRTARTWRC